MSNFFPTSYEDFAALPSVESGLDVQLALAHRISLAEEGFQSSIIIEYVPRRSVRLFYRAGNDVLVRHYYLDCKYDVLYSTSIHPNMGYALSFKV